MVLIVLVELHLIFIFNVFFCFEILKWILSITNDFRKEKQLS